MKNLKMIVAFAVLAITMMACSSTVEVNDNWKNENFKTLEGKKVLVALKTENTITKQRFEKDVAEELKNVGIDATPAHIAFPYSLTKQQYTEEEMALAIQKVMDAGYSGIVISVLRDQAQQTESYTTGGYMTGGYYPSYYGGYYRGFGSYYGGVYGYGYGYGASVYVPRETTTKVVDVYLFETVTYNLDLPDNEELVGAVSVKLTDPSSYGEVAPKYAKIIAEQFADIGTAK